MSSTVDLITQERELCWFANADDESDAQLIGAAQRDMIMHGLAQAHGLPEITAAACPAHPTPLGRPASRREIPGNAHGAPR